MIPIYDLQNKFKKFKWTQEAEKAFKEIKELLISPPVLRALTPKSLFRLESDTSYEGVHIPRQSDIDKIVKSIESQMIHGLQLPIQAQDFIKVYQTSTGFHDVYHYITDGKLPSGAKV